MSDEQRRNDNRYSSLITQYSSLEDAENQMLLIAKSLLYFVLAGLCEIGGGYLIWLWLREGRSVWVAVGGAAALVIYGVVPTLQPANFGRVYAAYGGVFIVLSLIWGVAVDRFVPDRFDLIGGALALAGAFVMMFWPRT
jgi:small multidrug resistance family-3 protein